MTYYTIVTKIDDKLKSGIYGRKLLDEKEYFAAKASLSGFSWLDSSGFNEKYLFPIIKNKFPILNRIYNQLKTKPLFLVRPINSKNKTIIITNDSLDGDYRIKDSFTADLLKNSQITKKLMTSKGGSDMLILERNDLPSNIKHISNLINIEGIESNFSEALYTVHPKDENILIPLKNVDDLIQKLILHETINSFVMLGAKSILIKDLTKSKLKNKASVKKDKAKISTSLKKNILHKKEYGKGTYNPELALKNKLFITDLLEVTGIIENRINGNQTLDSCKEKIDLSIGLDLNVVDAFSSKNKFEYLRNWQFKVEFYDKNEL